MKKQKYTSACTSVNSAKLPAIFKKIKWDYLVGMNNNLDYGGGKYDNATEYLQKEFGKNNYIYDPFNRTEEHNEAVLKQGPFDTSTLSNVLNVIYEREIRIEVLAKIKSLLAPYGRLYITAYEGNRSGVVKINEKKDSCQLNRKLKDYLEEVLEVFRYAEIKNGMIIAWER